MNEYGKAARGLEVVSPDAPMTSAALVMSLASQAGRPVTSQEISEAPAIPEGATRSEYARILRQG